jgi:hypothetical protein
MKKKTHGIVLLSVFLLVFGLGMFGILLVFWWQPILWVILLPLPVSTLNLGVRLWYTSTSSLRAVIYWGVCIFWVLGLVFLMFEDYYLLNFLITLIVTSVFVAAVYLYVKRAIG